MSEDAETPTGKGHPTRSRKEAEAARKKALKPAMTRKEQVQRDREARKRIRGRQQDALRSGDERFLPLRDRGPVKRFARDFVDRKRLIAEYLLPILLLALLVPWFLPPSLAYLGAVAFYAITIVTIVEEVVVIRGLRKELAKRFPDASQRGVVLYTILRTTQLRRFRLPKPQIERFQDLPEKY